MLSRWLWEKNHNFPWLGQFWDQILHPLRKVLAHNNEASYSSWIQRAAGNQNSAWWECLENIFKFLLHHYFFNSIFKQFGGVRNYLFNIWKTTGLRCESWTVKKAERRRIDAFELWCWRRLLRVPWTARRSNQSILKEINPGISLEGVMLKLKLQYFGHLMWRVDSLEKTDAGRDWGRRRRGRPRMRWLYGITDSMDVSQWTLGAGDGQGVLACCNSWGRKESDTAERLNWTELNWILWCWAI